MISPAGLVVGGYPCATRGETAVASIPNDNRYYLTTFGGGSDVQSVACGGPIADGTWYYAADSSRFGCNARILITNPANGRSVVAKVVDHGPNICVEQAAGKPVIDASPMVARHLFGVGGAGWSEHRLVIAVSVDRSTPLGPSTAVASVGKELIEPPGTSVWVTAGVLAAMAGAAWWWSNRNARR